MGFSCSSGTVKVSVHNFANPQYLPISSKGADLTFDLKVSVHNLTCFNPQISSKAAHFKFDFKIDLKI